MHGPGRRLSLQDKVPPRARFPKPARGSAAPYGPDLRLGGQEQDAVARAVSPRREHLEGGLRAPMGGAAAPDLRALRGRGRLHDPADVPRGPPGQRADTVGVALRVRRSRTRIRRFGRG